MSVLAMDDCGICNGPGAILTSADVLTSRKGTATAMGISLTPSVNVVALVRPMRT